VQHFYLNLSYIISLSLSADMPVQDLTDKQGHQWGR